MGSISILLLIACANVANLMLVRAESRGAELAVRSALGAGWAQMARGLMVESLMLSVIGGVIGVGLAYGGLRLLQAYGPGNLPRLNEITIDGSVLAFAFAVSILSGLLFGLAPAMKLAGRKFAANLAEFVHAGGRWASTGKNQHRSQNFLVVVQIALALVMLISSGLMIRTFQNIRNVDPGFTNPETIQTVRVSMPQAMFTEPDRMTQTERQILERLAAIPGVTSAGYVDLLPMQSQGDVIVAVEGEDYGVSGVPPLREVKLMSPGLLETVGTPIIAGRDVTWDEVAEQRNIALVSESFARKSWATPADAIGKRIKVGTIGPWQQVVGVVADVYNDGADQDPPDLVYWPARSHPYVGSNTMPVTVAYALRTDRAGTESLMEDIRGAVSAVMPDMPIVQVQTMATVYNQSMVRTSFSLTLLGIAGAMALLLGIVGIYGVLAYAVMQRQREVGIRLALGAQPRRVKGMFVYRGMLLSVAGIVLGTVAAVFLTRLMASLLFGVTPVDAVTFSAAACILVIAAVVASYLPARRAATVEPVQTLRAQ